MGYLIVSAAVIAVALNAAVRSIIRSNLGDELSQYDPVIFIGGMFIGILFWGKYLQFLREMEMQPQKESTEQVKEAA